MIYRLFAQVINQKDLKIPKADITSATFTSILETVFAIAGGLAMLIITIAGLRYVIARGNPEDTAKAKKTIIYAVVGLFVCIAAFSIINFVVERI